jgi:hypothetical protein
MSEGGLLCYAHHFLVRLGEASGAVEVAAYVAGRVGTGFTSAEPS